MTGVQLVSVCPALCLLITTNPCHHIGHRHHCHHCDHHHHRHHHHRLRAFFISDNDIYYIIHGIKSNYILSKKNCERYMTHPHVLCIVSCIDLEKALRSVTIDPALRSSWQVYHSSWRGVVTTPAFKTSPYSGRLVDFTEYITPWIWDFTVLGVEWNTQKLATRCVIDWMATLWCGNWIFRHVSLNIEFEISLLLWEVLLHAVRNNSKCWKCNCVWESVAEFVSAWELYLFVPPVSIEPSEGNDRCLVERSLTAQITGTKNRSTKF